MAKEFNALVKNGMWSLVPRTASMNLASRAWFRRLSDFLQRLGFHASQTDPSLFIYKAGSTLVYILVYVDDILVTGNASSQVASLLIGLAQEFPIKDLGNLHFFLGIEVIRHSKGLLLSQSRYISDLLKRSGMTECKAVRTPMAITLPASTSGGAVMADPTQYRSIVGALQYFTLTHPDVAFAVNQAFSDADWTGSSEEPKSIGGYAIFLGPNLISWNSRKQCIVARSSTKSGYKALADAFDLVGIALH
ncbi:uncharacterized mitochondrial protein AtMg00810-like [Macadamia integrifolia]|uniref:uncharacterized mitochondrial protein AtMg00810-like n=1 Tax=Macadamia integrifolia TaxID=60698 RepID=UPI001C4E75F0|nr:uncharacterized mitochondrial protein AtMg00810-like [Macadamia integrifolia]